MAWAFVKEWYVSSLASGGAGSEVDPWDWATMMEKINDGTVGDGERCNVKADGTYATTMSTIKVAGGAGSYSVVQGYTATAGDGGVATVQLSASASYLIDCNQSYWLLADLCLDGNSNATTACLRLKTNECLGFRVEAKNGSSGFLSGHLVGCNANNNTIYGFASCRCSHCLAYDNGTSGYHGSGGYTCVKCVGRNNGTQDFYMGQSMAIDCISDGAGTGGHGFTLTRGGGLINCSAINAPAGSYGVYFFYASSLANNIVQGLNCYGNDSDTNQAGAIDPTINAENPAYNDPASFDYSKTSSVLNGDGYGRVGGFDFDYYDAIGIGGVAGAATPVFAGITQLEAVGGGLLRAVWAAGSGTIRGYKVFVRADSATDLFTDTYLLCEVTDSLTEFFFRTEADGQTFMTDTKTYHVGIRAVNDDGEDANVISLSAIIGGDGSTYVKTPKIGLVI